MGWERQKNAKPYPTTRHTASVPRPFHRTGNKCWAPTAYSLLVVLRVDEVGS